MRLEGRPIGWFTSTIELILEGKVLGLLRRGWFREGLQLELSGRTVRLEKPSWLKSHYVLKDDEGIELCSATLVGFLNAHWAMELKSGAGDSRTGRMVYQCLCAEAGFCRDSGSRADQVVVAGVGCRG